jgi:hypothetical protein
MAKSQSWHSQDVRVYETDVQLDTSTLPPDIDPSDLNPGMSATVEIIVAELKDVLHIPVQAVSTYKGDRICWVKTPEGPEVRKVKTGHFTNTQVEILEGLKEGTEVYMAPATELDRKDEQAQEENNERTRRNERRESDEPGDQPEDESDTEDEEPQDDDTEAELSLDDLDVDALRDELADMASEERKKKMEELREKLSEEDARKLGRLLRPDSGDGEPSETDGEQS